MCRECEDRIASLEKLVMSLADKLATVAEHLGRISERKEIRVKECVVVKV